MPEAIAGVGAHVRGEFARGRGVPDELEDSGWRLRRRFIEPVVPGEMGREMLPGFPEGALWSRIVGGGALRKDDHG